MPPTQFTLSTEDRKIIQATVDQVRHLVGSDPAGFGGNEGPQMAPEVYLAVVPAGEYIPRFDGAAYYSQVNIYKLILETGGTYATLNLAEPQVRLWNPYRLPVLGQAVGDKQVILVHRDKFGKWICPEPGPYFAKANLDIDAGQEGDVELYIGPRGAEQATGIDISIFNRSPFAWKEDEWGVVALMGGLVYGFPFGTTAGTPPESTTELIRFRLQENLVLGGTPAAKKLVRKADNTGFEVTGSNFTVRESFGPPVWRAVTGSDGWCIKKDDWDEDDVNSRPQYEIIYVETQARFVRSHSSGDMNVGTSQLSVIQDYFWAGYDPGVNVTHDEDSFFPRILGPDGTVALGGRSAAKVFSIFDEQQNKNCIIQAHSKAGWITFTTTSTFALSGGVVQASCNITGFGGTQQDIQNPCISAAPIGTVVDLTGLLNGTAAGFKGVALLDTANDRYVVAPWQPASAPVFRYGGLVQGFVVTTSDGDVDITGYTSGIGNGATVDTTLGTITVETDGSWYVWATANVVKNNVTSASDQITLTCEMYLQINSTPQQELAQTRAVILGGASSIEALCFTAPYSLSAGDVLKLRFDPSDLRSGGPDFNWHLSDACFVAVRVDS